MMYGSSDMECTDRIFSFFKNVFCPFIPLSTQKSKFWKTEKIVWRYHHFTHLSHKWQSYDVWLLRYRVQWTEFFVTLYHFLPFYPLTTWKIKIWKNEKKTPRDIITSHICTINDNHMNYVSWIMEHDGHNFLSFWTIFCTITCLNNPKHQNFEKKKKPPGDISLHTCVS